MRAGFEMLRFLWQATRGHRLRPWRSPYLRWRIETYAGIAADSIDLASFWAFVWRERRGLVSYLRWTGAMRAGRSRPPKPRRPPARR